MLGAQGKDKTTTSAIAPVATAVSRPRPTDSTPGTTMTRTRTTLAGNPARVTTTPSQNRTSWPKMVMSVVQPRQQYPDRREQQCVHGGLRPPSQQEHGDDERRCRRRPERNDLFEEDRLVHAKGEGRPPHEERGRHRNGGQPSHPGVHLARRGRRDRLLSHGIRRQLTRTLRRALKVIVAVRAQGVRPMQYGLDPDSPNQRSETTSRLTNVELWPWLVRLARISARSFILRALSRSPRLGESRLTSFPVVPATGRVAGGWRAG